MKVSKVVNRNDSELINRLYSNIDADTKDEYKKYVNTILSNKKYKYEGISAEYEQDSIEEMLVEEVSDYISKSKLGRNLDDMNSLNMGITPDLKRTKDVRNYIEVIREVKTIRRLKSIDLYKLNF